MPVYDHVKPELLLERRRIRLWLPLVIIARLNDLFLRLSRFSVKWTAEAIQERFVLRAINLSRAGVDCATADELYSGHQREAKSVMRIYVFKSESPDRLRAFAGDPDVHKLPRQHGPWTATGTISPDKAPPYDLSRDAIEKAINAEGFQLWRFRDKK